MYSSFFWLWAFVTLLYIKWIAVILFLPLQIGNNLGVRCRNKATSLFLRLPYRAFQHLTVGGMEKLCLYQMSTFPSIMGRKWYYRLCGATIRHHATLHFRTEIRTPCQLFIDEGSVIGDNCILDARRGLHIGKNVNLSSNVSIYTLQHNHRNPDFDCEFPDRKMEVNIGDRAWLGSNTVVLPGVNIGEGAVICAGAVVTKDVPPFAVMAGIPAKQVGERPKNLRYELNSTRCWFY